MSVPTMRQTGIASVAALSTLAPPLLGASNVSDVKKHTWGENIGWMNWADANARAQGAEIDQSGATQRLAGFVWCENIGWINLGDGNAPYANTDATDFGVNIDPSTGEMSGFAWGENVGWLSFGPFPGATIATPARWDHAAFRSRGWAWGENVGWINLDDAIRFVCSVPGDLDFNGAVDVFDFGLFAPNFGATGVPPFTGGDIDGDGAVDVFDFGLFAPNFGESCP